MLIYVYGFLLIINFILFLSGRTCKPLAILTEIFVTLFVAGERLGHVFAWDQRNYKINYENDNDIIEVGYKFCENIGHALNLSYEEFYTGLAIIFMILMLWGVNRMKTNLHLFLPAFMLYYITIPGDLVKNFCAFAIFLFFIKYIRFKEKKDYVLYGLGVVLAALFHPTFLVFLIFYLAAIKKKEFFYKVLAVVVSISSLIIVLLKQQKVVSRILSSLIASINTVDKYTKYVSSVTGWSALAYILLMIAGLILVIYWKKRCIEQPRTDGLYDVEAQEQSETAFKIAVIIMLLFPFIMVNITFYRFFKDILMVEIMYIGINTTYRYVGKGGRFIIGMGAVAIAVGLFYIEIVANGYWENYYLEDMFNNAILRW